MDHYLDKQTDEETQGPGEGQGKTLVDDEDKLEAKNTNINPEPYLKDQKTALSKEFGTWYSVCMIVFLILNAVIVLISHLGSSLLVRTSLDDTEVELVGACTNDADEAILVQGSEALTGTSTYLKNFFQDCGENEACINDLAIEEFGFTFDCASCLAQYGLCLNEFCSEECYGDVVDTASCLQCSDINCEFSFEICAGREDFVGEVLEDSCVNEKDSLVFIEGSEIINELPTYLPAVGIACQAPEDVSQEVCVKQEMFERFGDLSDDCAGCSFQLLECIQDNCVAGCFGDLPNPNCVPCLLDSGCAAEYEFCTGLEIFESSNLVGDFPSRLLQTTDLCVNDQDLAILIPDSEALTETATYLPGFAFGCSSADNQRQCLIDSVVTTFNLTSECASCSADYTFCLLTGGDCTGFCAGPSANVALCEECANNFGCEFAFEQCSGINYVQDSNVNACVNAVDNNIFVSDSEALTGFTTYVPEALRLCGQNLGCVQAEFLNEFSMTEDCSSCLVGLGGCMAQNCAPDCFAAELPAPGCEACLEASVCANQLETCSGISFLDPSDVTAAPTEQPTTDLCRNDEDLAILVPGSEALTQSAIYIPQIVGFCVATSELTPDCVRSNVESRFGLSTECASCSSDYAFCLATTSCQPICLVPDADPVACEECANNFGCEFTFETCSGINYVVDNEIDSCVNEVDEDIFVADSVALTEFDRYIPELLRTCTGDATCIQDSLLTEFQMTEDCSSCLVDLSNCMAGNCGFGVCFGPDLPLETCIPCLEDSVCAPQLETCTGLNFFGDPAPSEPPTGAPTDTAPLAFNEDGSCLKKEQFEIFDSREITFFFAVERTIEGGSIGLALILGIASGAWPYAKNILMAYAWFGTLTQRRRDIILRSLAVLGKWSFLDVFAVILIVDGLTIQFILTRSGLPFVVFAEPRAGIYWFGLAAIWALAQGEVIRYFEKTHLKQRKIGDGGSLIANLDEKDRNIAYFKVVLGISAGISLLCSLLGVFLPNLKMTVLGKINNNEGPGETEFNIFQLAAGLADDCAIHDTHGSPTGAVFLAGMLVLLVVVIPILTCILMLIVSFTFHPSRRDNFFIGFSFGLGNFACLDVWFIALFVFSNQFEALVSGALGDDANNCPITQDEINSGIICVGLQGETGAGGFFLGAAAVSFWIAQYASVKLMQNSFKFVGTYVEYDQSV